VVWALAAWCLAAGAAQAAGNPGNGATIVANRAQGLCSLCHAVPGQPPALQGTIGPPLAGVGERLDATQLRDRLLTPERFNPDTVMPAYGRSSFVDERQQRVAPALRGKPLLTPAQIDDVVAYLAELR
jgi:sulfur-oxidizing protein SoxX